MPYLNRSALITFLEDCECPPSWTQYYVGKNHAFVMTAISSSDDITMRLNMFVSGS